MMLNATADPYDYRGVNLSGKIDSDGSANGSVFQTFTNAVGSSYSSARRVVFGEQGAQRSGNISLMSLGYKKVMHFAICLAVGALFFMMSFLFLPMVVISPQKFTLLFALGCMSWIVGLGVLQGPGPLVAAMLRADRLPFTAGYLASVLGVFYATLVAHSYLLTLLFSGVQIAALCAFIISYFPGGLKLLAMMREYVVSRFRGESFLPM